MREDKLLYSEKVLAGKRIYFLDLKEDQQGYKIFKITESRKNGDETIRHSVLFFQEDFEKVFEALAKVKENI